MDILGPLLQLLFRAFFVVLPLTIGWLAFRRLMLSRSGNAWIYATTCLFTAIITAGLLPWTLGIGSAGWLFFVFSALSPVIWMGVVTICDPLNEPSSYDTEDADDVAVTPTIILRSRRPTPQTKTLVLEQPKWPEAPTPMFRHSRAAPAPAEVEVEDTLGKSLLKVAKEMRGNDTSDDRRPRLLPSPDRYGTDLPFLHRS